jgi:hypothetical protein
VRTRTLLLLAVGCGLAILVAGVVQLLRIAGQDDPPAAASMGEAVRVGDLRITVERFEEAADTATVTVELAGVDDPDGADGFRLVVPGAALQPVGDDSGDLPACAETTVEPLRCALRFDLASVDGSSRVLLYRRGDEQARWELG